MRLVYKTSQVVQCTTGRCMCNSRPTSKCFKNLMRIMLKTLHLKFINSLRKIHTSSQWEIDVYDKIKDIEEPLTKATLGYLNCIQGLQVDGGLNVSIDLDLFVAGYPYAEDIKANCKKAISRLPWAGSSTIKVLAPKKFGGGASMEAQTLKNIGHIIGISSCKGGVGKSTVAVNLAHALANRGLRVGLLDADIYGPSLPHLIEPSSRVVRKSSQNSKNIVPLESIQRWVDVHPLKLMSFGFVNPGSGAPGAGGREAAVVRGPIATKILNQLILCTEWGELDYLLVDMPPGTGDIQITLTQSVVMSGAVVVSTPHRLSLVDAAKGVAMFDSLKVPTLSLVENMSYFQCEHGQIYHPFGKGGRDKLLLGLASISGDVPADSPIYQRLSTCPIVSLPLVDQSSDEEAQSREAIVVRHRDSELAKKYGELAFHVLGELFKKQTELSTTPTISLQQGSRQVLLRYFTASTVDEYKIPLEELRRRDPKTGKRLPRQDRVDYEKLQVTKVDTKGIYGVAFVWSDGYYADIFPYDVLKIIALEVGAAGSITA